MKLLRGTTVLTTAILFLAGCGQSGPSKESVEKIKEDAAKFKMTMTEDDPAPGTATAQPSNPLHDER